MADVTTLRVGVAGAGATGGYLAAALANAGVDVTLLARGRSADAISRDGLVVRGPGDREVQARPTSVVRAGEDVRPVDVTLFCVKSYDTEQAAQDVEALVGSDGAILCLQNGVANEDVLADRYSKSRIMSGVLYIGAERVAPGVIECSTDARITFGPYDGRTTEPMWAPLQQMLTAAGVTCTIDEHIRAAKWQKFLFNCGLNPLTALTRQKLGSIRAEPAGQGLFEGLIDEALCAALASGAPLATDAKQQVLATADRMDISSSMAEDLAAGRPMELDAFTGHVLRLARAHQTSADRTAVVHDLLRVLDGHGS
jgi:2-dehydropantoate 2-reductase